MNRWLVRILLILGVTAVVFTAGSWIAARQLTGARPTPIGAVPNDFPFPIESITFPTRDGETLAGWLVPADKSAPAIVLLHGYRGTRRQMIQRAKLFRALGYAALLYDARGCGESTGDAVTFGYRESADLIAALEWMRARGHQKIACLGVSQGGATILYAGEELGELCCVVCESVYDEMANAVDRRTRRVTFMPGWLAGSALVPFAERRLALSIDEMKPVERIARLSCPLFVISGDQDDRTWPEDTWRLFEAAREPKELWMIPGARHEDLFRFDRYEQRVTEFVQRHVK